MRIAFVSDAVYPYNKGGKEKRLFEISTRLAREGHDVNIYCMKWWQGKQDITENGVHLHAISSYFPLYTKHGKRSIVQAIWFGASCFKMLFEDFDAVEVDHFPFFPVISMRIVTWIKQKKLVCTWHEVWGNDYWRKYLGTLGFFGYLTERISAILPDKIIAVSGLTTRRLKEELKTKKKVVTIYNGVDIEQIESISPSKHKSDIIYVGRLLEHKHVDLLIKAVELFTKQRPISCIIIGEGPEKQSLEQLVKSLKLTKYVKFLGFLDKQEDVFGLMKSSKVFVFPSTREGFGIIVLEANACGLPVIVINTPENAAKDLIKINNNGFLINLDAVELTNSIVEALKQSKKLQKKCTMSARKFQWSTISNNILGEYRTC